MTPNENEDEEIDDLESRLDRLWGDQERLPGIADHGQTFGRYHVNKAIGAGAFGIVYLAVDFETDEPVAIKVPRAEVLVDREKLARFIDEAKLIADLTHPSIVRFLSADTSGPVPWIVTEWCDGSDLGSWLQKKDSRGNSEAYWKDVARFVAAIADAIHHVHQQGIAHRDIKPTNIMLSRIPDSDGSNSLSQFTPKVADFGLSKLHSGDLVDSMSSVILGTPFYMAPECMDGSNRPSSSSGPSVMNSDIYSLGVILFELLTGRLPVEGHHYYEVMANAQSLRRPRAGRLEPEIPPALDRICATCLRVNPDARYASAEDLATDLRRFVEGESIVGRKYPLTKRYGYWHGLQPWKKIAGAFTMFYCFVIGLWFTVTVWGNIAFGGIEVGDFYKLLPDAISLILTSLLLPGVIGWLCWTGRRWAAIVGFLLNLPKALVYLAGMLGKPVMFPEYYENYNAYISFTVHLFFFICTGTQLALYVFAMRNRDKGKVE